MKFLNTKARSRIIFLLGMLPLMLMAQPKDNSIYSRHGIGDINNRNFLSSHLMGDLGASFLSPTELSIVNPASLGFLDLTALDIGLNAEYSNLNDRTNPSVAQWSGKLNNICLGFTLSNSINDLLERKVRDFSVGMAFNLSTYSTVGYNVNNNIFNQEIGEVQRLYQGSGGTYDFSWNNGIRYKNFSGGFTLGTVFGRINQERILEFLNLTQAINSLVAESTRYAGFHWRLGALYNINLNKPDKDAEKPQGLRRLVIGMYGNSSSRLTGYNDSFEGTARISALGTFVQDTFFNLPDTLSLKLPAELGIGLTYYGGSQVALGLNYSTTAWSSFDNGAVNETLNNAYSLSFGGYFRPNSKSISNYFARVKYKFGFFHRQLSTPLAINNGKAVNDTGVTFGMGLPFFYQRKSSQAHIGVTLGIKGLDTIIEEQYIQLNFSFTFNDDEWFLKRKYN